MKIGYIGLGLMGKPSCRHLMKAGNELYIWARNPEKVKDLVAKGAILCKNTAEVAKQVEILFTNLSDTPDVEQVLLGPDGVESGANPGLIVIDMSTISAEATREMATRLEKNNIMLVDAPVSGGTAGAQNATLTIMVGAKPEVFEKIRPVLSILGTTITRIGDVGAGQVAKSCNQIAITVGIMAVAEALKFAEKFEVDPAIIREALLGGLAGSKIMEIHALRMISDKFEPGFKTHLHLKDMEIVNRLAADKNIQLPASKMGIKYLKEAMQAGYAEEDSAVISRIIDKL